MKNLLLGSSLLIMNAFIFMSFTSPNDGEDELSITTEIQFEENSAEDAPPCRWRTCTYRNGELVGCTDWEYGHCDTLPEVVVEG